MTKTKKAVAGSKNGTNVVAMDDFVRKANENFTVMAYSFVVPEATINLPKALEGTTFEAMLRAEYAVCERSFRNEPLKWRKRLERWFKEDSTQVVGKSTVFMVSAKRVRVMEERIKAAQDAYELWYENTSTDLQESIDDFMSKNKDLASQLKKKGVVITAKGVLSNCGFYSSSFNGGVRSQIIGQESDEEYAQYVKEQALERARMVRESIAAKLEAVVAGKKSLNREGQEKIVNYVDELAEAEIFDVSFGEQAKQAKAFLSQFEKGKIKDELFVQFVDGIREVLGTKKVANVN